MEQTVEKKAMIFDIQRFSVHDGPGIRTIIFFKGCPLNCTWCCNPESQNYNKQLMLVRDNCIDCRRCETVCPYDAISFNPTIEIDRNKCVNCGACSEVCFSEALTMVGRKMTISELIEELKKDAVHYRKSNGGITLSGGEALAQPEAAKELLKASQEQGWHTAIESTGYATEKVLRSILPHLDLFLLDIKHINSIKHRKYVGKSNELILKSAKIIAEYPGTELAIRVPVVPGFNDHPEEIAEIALIAKELRATKLYLLPYHPYGANKYGNLGRQYQNVDTPIPTQHQIEVLKELVENLGVACQIGG
ncbi:glycyl-radical enzyme activating protein [Niallia hominis]|uniref:Glycyl-radical enzyme activating protein n=1 Tax=Niallia hominis TaxID=3133173 RepID=A0ABV1EY78_9BACI